MNTDEKVLAYPNSIETRVALLEACVSNINQTLIRLENKMDRGFEEINRRFIDVDRKFDDMNHKFARIEGKMDKQFSDVGNVFIELRKESRSDFRWILTVIGGLGFIMAHGFHWF